MNEVKVLETCRKVEEAAGRLYRVLAKVHQETPGIVALWTKTAREEDNHAQQITLVLRKRQALSGQVAVDISKAEKALKLIEDTIDTVTADTPSHRQALEEAVVLEHLLMAFHADYVMRFDDPTWAQLFKAMMAADQDHIGALESALKALRD